MSQPLRLGRIEFVNILPVYMHLEPHPGLYELTLGVPSALNRKLRSGELDISVISSVEYALHADEYLLLPDLSIASGGAVGSVCLFSQKPMGQWRGGVIEAPFESDTSVALIRVLLRWRWQLTNGLAAEGRADDPVARLRIGDRALAEAASGKWAHVWDMGLEWRELTGLPFVFAVWAVRRDVAARRPADVDRLHRALTASRLAGRGDLAGCAEEAAMALGRPHAEMAAYFRGLHFGLGTEFRQGLEMFYQYLAQLGLIAAKPPLEFFLP